jgi:hypothetical protein
MYSTNTVRMDSHATATLRYIRDSMESAASLAVPGSAGIAMGMVGILAALLSAMPKLHAHWLAIWLIAALAAGIVGSALLGRESSLSALLLAGTPLRRFALCLFPSLFAGAVMTAAHWWVGNLHAIPGTWLLLYGCALIAASAATTRTIALLGGSFSALGLLALILPDRFQILMLGLGFGGTHLVFGLLIGWRGHGREV